MFPSSTPPPLPAFSHIHRTPTTADVNQSKKLYKYGFCLLPILWIINYLMFKQTLKWEDTPQEMKHYVRSSLIAFIMAATMFLVWLVIYYHELNGFSDIFTVFDVLDNQLTQGTYS